MKNTLGSKIEKKRKEMGLSQLQIAQSLHITPQAVGKWERGESLPDILMLGKLANVLGVDLNYFAQQIEGLTSDTLLFEIEQLKAQIDLLRKNYTETKAERDVLKISNDDLRDTLSNQLASEKLRFLSNSKQKMAAYFNSAQATDESLLDAIEKSTRTKFDGIRRAINSNIATVNTEINTRVEVLETEVANEIERLRQQIRNNASGATAAHEYNVASIEQEKIDNTQADAVLKKSHAERFIGTNFLGKIGAVIIIFGVIALSQYIYAYLDDFVKTIFLFGVASLILGFALFINWKKQTVFSITILSLGIALEYTALSISYFSIGSLNIWVALVISILITTVSYFISAKFKAEPVAIFANIGGYLPAIAIYGDINLLYGAMVYFLILNAFSFLLSMKFKWQYLNFFGFALAAIGAVFVSASVGNMYWGQSFGLAQGVALAYTFVAFVVYIVLPVLTNIKRKVRFNRPDFILMTISTAMSSILLYTMFYVYGVGNYTGYLTLLFAAIYLGLYFFVRKYFVLDKQIGMMFWLAGVVFVFLIVPFSFGTRWLSFAWALQGVAMVIYGIYQERKIPFLAGAAISFVCILNFIFIDAILNFNVVGTVNIFAYKYGVITIASIAVLATLIIKQRLILGYLSYNIFKSQEKTPSQFYSVAVYLNAAVFLVYLTYELFNIGDAPYGSIRYLMLAIMIGILFLLATVVPKLFKGFFVQHASIGISAVSLVFLLVVNSFGFQKVDDGAGYLAIYTVTTIAITFASVYVFYDLLVKFLRLAKIKRPITMVALTVYTLFWFTHILLISYNVSFINVSYSIVYIVSALFVVIWGLYKRNPLTRRFALGLAAVAIVKLFLLDTFRLDLIYRIIGYFAFGIVLIGMSYAYHIFTKKFDVPNVVSDNTNDLMGSQTVDCMLSDFSQDTQDAHDIKSVDSVDENNENSVTW